MSDPPSLLRMRGRTACLDAAPTIAIVGSRRASAVGIDLAARFATTLTENGVTVCSGGARGIDAAAVSDRDDGALIAKVQPEADRDGGGGGRGPDGGPDHRGLHLPRGGHIDVEKSTF